MLSCQVFFLTETRYGKRTEENPTGQSSRKHKATREIIEDIYNQYSFIG